MGAVFLITDDGRGIAQTLADELRRLDRRPVLVRMGNGLSHGAQDLYAADLADPNAVGALLGAVRQRQGPIAGLLHLLPLRAGTPFEAMDFGGWRQRLRQEVKSLFYLARAAAPDLTGAGAGGGWVIAATAMGGTFGSDGQGGSSLFPGHGGIAGLIKTFALEWPRVCCKAVDFTPEEPAASVVRRLVDEMAAGDGQFEVGYPGARRLVLQVGRAPLDCEAPAGLEIDPSWVVLVTGGARGITAEGADELAGRYRPTLVVVGRAPLPVAEESPDTAGLSAPQALKAALMDRMRRAGQSVRPREVEAAYTRLLHDREMRSSLTAMRRSGATVRYCPVDVRDPQAFGALIDEIYQVHGRLDGVIHGAGVIEDKLLEDKTPDSFDRVFDTKVDSAFILTRHLRPDSLKFLVFFSSMAGRFGNRGQADYAAANEVLNKLAVYLDRRWPARVVAINWGPWAKTGMVSAEVQKQFAQRGVQLIPPAAGRRMLDAELRHGRKGQAEVVIGDGPWGADAASQPSSPGVAFPLLQAARPSLGAGGSVELMYHLDPGRDRYLDAHRLDGKPVFPAAMAVELMAEVVQASWPEFAVVGIRALQVLKGIILDDGPRSLQVVARPQAQPVQERPELEVDVEIRELEQPAHICYRATVQIAQRLPEPPPYEPLSRSGLREFPMPVDEAYRHWLFHGPCLQGITKIEGIAEQGIVAVLTPSSPPQCLAGSPAGQWLIDPVLLDSSFQLAILWERAHHDMTPLPSGFRSYRRFGPAPGAPVRCDLQAQSSAGGHILVTNICFVDAAGRVIGLLEEMEFSCSPALNRLAGCAAPVRGGGR